MNLPRTTRTLYSSPTLRWVILIRLLLLLQPSFQLLPQDLTAALFNSAPLEAVLWQPSETPAAIQDAVALRKLVLPMPLNSKNEAESAAVDKFANSYALSGIISTPPLVLAALEPLVGGAVGRINEIHHENNDDNENNHSPQQQQYLLLGLFLLLVDLLIAQTLIQIASRMYHKPSTSSNNNDNHQNSWERRLQAIMPEAIQPRNKALADWIRIDEESEQEEQQDYAFPTVIGLLYVASPVTILAGSVGYCYQNIRLLFLLWAIDEVMECSNNNNNRNHNKPNENDNKEQEQQRQATPSTRRRGSAVAAAAFFCLAVLLDAPIGAMFLPLVLMVPPTLIHRAAFLFGTLLTSTILLGLTYALIGGGGGPIPASSFGQVLLDTTLGHSLRLAGAAPSLSILWYMQMEMFARFARYFQIVLTPGLPLTLVIPTTMRLHRYPMETIAIFWMTWTIFRPTSTLYELNVGLCLFALCPRTLVRMNDVICIVALAALMIPAILFVVLHWMWLQVGNGEANFLFFQALAYNILVLTLLLQFVSATVARDKANCLTEKELQRQRQSVEGQAEE